MSQSRFRPRLLTIVLLTVLTACTSPQSQQESSATTAGSSTTPATSIVTPESTTLTSVADSTSSEADPLRAAGDPPDPAVDYIDESVWLSRKEMTGSSIELQLGLFDGAVEYQLHRLPWTSKQRPNNSAMTNDTVILTVTDNGSVLDDDVVEGNRYWYGLRALDADGVAIAHGWHPAAAVTDTEPPMPVEVTSAELIDGEIWLTWAEPSENYELHGYRVIRLVEGAEPETLASTWDLDQRSFIDDAFPTDVSVSYAVLALDFHWNLSDPAPIKIETP